MNRLDKLVGLMDGYMGALITPGTNFYYLTGLNPSATGERLFLLALNREGESVIIAPKLYENEVKENWEGRAIFWCDDENPYLILKGVLDELNLRGGKILVEDTMPAMMLVKIENILMDYELGLLSTLTSKLRIKKDSGELKLMEKAAQVVDDVFHELIEKDLEGMNEKQVAALIEYLIKERADGISFEPIVAAGENGANPHHTPSDRKLKKGDLVILDYGAKYKGYCSDITRTIAIGKPSELALEVYDVVKEAQERAVQAVREGITAKEIDAVARGEITKKGYGEYFIHRTGHGLGLDVHEEPYIAQHNEIILEEGMAFTIEPGIYIPGRVGVRIEDDVAIINGKGKRLTKAGKELIVL